MAKVKIVNIVQRRLGGYSIEDRYIDSKGRVWYQIQTGKWLQEDLPDEPNKKEAE